MKIMYSEERAIQHQCSVSIVTLGKVKIFVCRANQIKGLCTGWRALCKQSYTKVIYLMESETWNLTKVLEHKLCSAQKEKGENLPGLGINMDKQERKKEKKNLGRR